jgi:hypothetical protein
MGEMRQPSEYIEQVLYFAIQTARAKDFEYANSMRVDVSLSLKELEYVHDCVACCEGMRGGQDD